MDHTKTLDVLCNATQDDAALIVSRLPGYRVVEPMATPGYSVEQNRVYGLVGIARKENSCQHPK